MTQKHHGMAKFQGLVKKACQEGNPNRNLFGRLFCANKNPIESREKLGALAKSMNEGEPKPQEDSDLPAGFIFFGQFVDHDLTLDVVSRLNRVSDPASIENVRTPRLELDSLYGDGPEATPFFYDQNREEHFLIGNEKNPCDLPRNSQGVALIGDHRNDENGVISQLHLLFLRFHNAVLEQVEQGKLKDDIGSQETPFEKARRIVRWHYQWIIRNQFLPGIIAKDVLAKVEDAVFDQKHGAIRGIHLRKAPIMPVEFSVAAYRFGHSQVRSRYTINEKCRDVELFRPPASALSAFMPVPPENVIDWNFFFDIDGSQPQVARKIDTLMAQELFKLPFVRDPEAIKRGEDSLAFRNLLRGEITFALISGEDAAKELKVEPIPTHPKVKAAGLEQTPLWFYCLAEAEKNDGKLGDVGGGIVALTILRILKEDRESYVHYPNWQPTITDNGHFMISDLIKFVRSVEA